MHQRMKICVYIIYIYINAIVSIRISKRNGQYKIFRLAAKKKIYIFYINNQMENYLGAWFTLLVVMFGDATIICL